MIKIIFREKIKELAKDILLINIAPENKDEIEKENGQRTFYLRCDKKVHLRKVFLLIRKMVAVAKNAKADKISFNFQDFKFKDIKISPEELAEIVGVEIGLANYEFIKYKSKKESTFIKEIYIAGVDKNVEKSILRGLIISEEINKARDLANTPGGDMTPKILAENARQAVKGLPVKVSALGEKEMTSVGMQAILSVGRGSDEESKFIIMEYKGGKKNEKPIVFVGKGVTFDSGGINLKPSTALSGMNMDMSGGAAVIHALALVARMKLNKNVVGLIPAVENFVSGKSYRPGDIIRSMSGITIEILNTDAEGRVILADALTYAEKYKPEIVLDVATLTGASVVALGERISGVFTDDDELCVKLEKIGDKTGDYLWRLPMWEEYEAEIRGSVGDWTNVHNKDSRYGGATYGAIFLKQFAKNYKWAHLDIAPRMTSMPGEFLAPGALGTPVYLLYKFVEER